MTAPGPVKQRPAGWSPFAGIARIRSLGVAVQPLSCPRLLSLSSRLRVSPALRSVQLPRSPRRRYSRCMAPVTAPRAESPACTGRTSCFSEARDLAGRRRSCFQVWPQGHSLAVAVGGPCREPIDSQPLRAPGQSHSRTVVSLLAVASSRPSGLNATSATQLVWPVRVRRQSRPGRPAMPGCSPGPARTRDMSSSAPSGRGRHRTSEPRGILLTHRIAQTVTRSMEPGPGVFERWLALSLALAAH